MQPMKILKVQFDAQISAQEIPAFRGAMIATVGQENDWFSNHLEGESLAYRYPKIQYKRARQNPLLVCLEEGVDEMHKFFAVSEPVFRLKGREVAMPVKTLLLKKLDMQVHTEPQAYQIHHWLGLNTENYQQYQQLKYQTEQLLFLEKKLVSNIISFAKGIRWHIKEHFEVKITRLHRQSWMRYKDQRFMAFDLDFETQVFLPKDIGLGRKVSVGFGVVRPIRTK